MLTREQLQGTWNQIKGQVRERWGQITDDELQQVQGDAEQFLGLLQRKTGQSRDQLEKFVQSAIDGGSDVMSRGREYVKQATTAARDYAEQAGQSMREGYESMEAGMEEGFEDARNMVKTRPVESVTAAFGAGLLAGVLLSLMLRSSRA